MKIVHSTLWRQIAFGILLSTAAASSMAQRASAPTRVAAPPSGSVTVLVAHPVVASLTQQLTHNTGIAVEVMAPANIPPTRMASYFHGRGARALTSAATKADAVIGIRSIWSADPLYPLARRTNIRIVEIDAAKPIDGELPGIAVQPGSDFNAYPWLHSVNLGRMADVIAADLERLAPVDKDKIAANLGAIKHRLVSMSAKTEAELANVNNVSVVSLSDRLHYLIASFNLDLVENDVLPDDEWTDTVITAFAARLKAEGVAVVLHHQAPVPALQKAIADAGVALVVLTVDGNDPIAEQEANSQALLQAFKK